MGLDDVSVAWVERRRLVPPAYRAGAAFGDVDLFHRVGSFQAAAATQCQLSVRQAVAPGAAAARNARQKLTAGRAADRRAEVRKRLLPEDEPSAGTGPWHGPPGPPNRSGQAVGG